MAVTQDGFSFKMPAGGFTSICQPDDWHAVPASTKTICTLGPQTRSVDMLVALLKAGMTVARFDFSYGTPAYHLETYAALQEAVRQTQRLCAVMLDTQGPEIIVRKKEDDKVNLSAGQEVVVSCDAAASFDGVSTIPISLENFEDTGVEPGSTIFIGQYLHTGSETTSAYLTVKQVAGSQATCVCNNACVLEGLLLTVHIAGFRSGGRPNFTEKDVADIQAWSAAAPGSIDFVSLSFCRRAADVENCREVLKSLGLEEVQVIAKLEDVEGLRHYEQLAEAADGIILSRGNMGTDLPPEKVFVAQKVVLSACNRLGKPCIVARVVDTMTDAPRPTRAEATDVANVVLDGADAILLGSETWRGKYPVETVHIINRIAKQAEQAFDDEKHYRQQLDNLGGYSNLKMLKDEALASSAVRAVNKMNVKLIVSFSTSGTTPLLLAKYKPAVPILTVVVPCMRVREGNIWEFSGQTLARQCLLYRGVVPLLADPTLGHPNHSTGSLAGMLRFAVSWAAEQRWVSPGDNVIVFNAPTATQTGSLHFIQVEDPRQASYAGSLGSSADLSAMGGACS